MLYILIKNVKIPAKNRYYTKKIYFEIKDEFLTNYNIIQSDISS